MIFPDFFILFLAALSVYHSQARPIPSPSGVPIPNIQLQPASPSRQQPALPIPKAVGSAAPGPAALHRSTLSTGTIPGTYRELAKNDDRLAELIKIGAINGNAAVEQEQRSPSSDFPPRLPDIDPAKKNKSGRKPHTWGQLAKKNDKARLAVENGIVKADEPLPQSTQSPDSPDTKACSGCSIM